MVMMMMVEITLLDVLINGDNVEERIGKVLLVANKDHVNLSMNGILNVKVVHHVINVFVLLVVVTNGHNVEARIGKDLLVV